MTARDRLRALAARLWPPHAQPSCPGARRGPASHTARRGEASGGQSRPQTTVCAAVWRALFDRAEEPPRPGQREERGLREAAEPASLRHGKERGRGVRKQGAEARRCGVLQPRAEAPARESTRSCREPPSPAAEWTGREPTSSRTTAWCRAALEPRRSARTPSGRRPSQPPARGLNRTSSGPLARLRTARAAGCGGGRSAGLGESARHLAECVVGADFDTMRLQVAGLQAGSVFILTAHQNVACKNEWQGYARARIRQAGRTLLTSPPALEAFVGRRRGRARCNWGDRMQTRRGLNAQARHPAFLRRRPP